MVLFQNCLSPFAFFLVMVSCFSHFCFVFPPPYYTRHTTPKTQPCYICRSPAAHAKLCLQPNLATYAGHRPRATIYTRQIRFKTQACYIRRPPPARHRLHTRSRGSEVRPSGQRSACHFLTSFFSPARFAHGLPKRASPKHTDNPPRSFEALT